MFSPAYNLKLIERLRTLRINIDGNNATVGDEGSPDSDAIHDINQIFSENLLSDDDGGNSVSSSDGDEESCADEMYAICQTIDESLLGLYAFNEERCKLPDDNLTLKHNYDWLLDGDLQDDGLTPKSRRRKRFGEPAFDRALEMMELEDPSLVTASCSPDSELDETLDSGEGIIEFADFTKFDCDDSAINANGGVAENNDAELSIDEGLEGFSKEEGQQSDVKFDEKVDEIQVKDTTKDDSFIGCVVDTSTSPDHVKCSQFNSQEASYEYTPPDEIHQLVTNLDAELDITIDECLNTSVDTPVEEGDDYINDDSLESRGRLQLSTHVNLQSKPHNSENLETPKSTNSQKVHQYPLLMSSMLMESLPMPIPDMDTDQLATFTYRVQKEYRDMSGLHTEETDMNMNTEILDDQIIEKKLVDILHSGYFEGAGGDDDNFDSIVLDEVLNVPWPFYQLDLNEPIVENEYNVLDPEEVDSSNELNFDSYIFNRLSQLDASKGEVMNSIIARVSLKKESIDAGNERILAAELDVAAALMYANSSRECVQRMLSGYPIDAKSFKYEQHNVITGGLNVLEIADARDRLHYLGATIERISEICAQEILFWNEIPNLKSHNSFHLRPEQYHGLIEHARQLYNLTLDEEVLNHVTSLHTLRDRIHRLPAVLLECMEDSIANLIQQMLNTDDVCNDLYLQNYESLVSSWISFCQLARRGGDNDDDSDTSEEEIVDGKKSHNYDGETCQITSIADGWSSCLLKAFCFEVSKAYIHSMIDTLESDAESFRGDLERLKCSLTSDSDIEALLASLLENKQIMSQAFSHQALRSTEILSVFCLLSKHHSAILDKLESKKNEPDPAVEGDSGNVSSISADELSSAAASSSSSTSEGTDDEQPDTSLPHTFEFQNKTTNLETSIHRCMLKSMNRSIRHPLFTFCELKLTQSIEYCISCSSMKLQLEDLCMMDDVFHQFSDFAVVFLGGEHDEDSDTCENIELSLAELHRAHLRSVHIEAMKTTGTLLRHETWQISLLDFTLASTDNDEKKSDGGGNIHQEQNAVLIALQNAVLELLTGAMNNATSKQINIADRAILHGHGQCHYLMDFLSKNIPSQDDKDIRAKKLVLRDCDGLQILASSVMQFVEWQPHLSVSIMTQSAANGLLKWTARLLSVGIKLPSVANDAMAAVKTLFDLYILTVFRICGRSRINEDTLIGLDKNETNASKPNAGVLSLTIEADICSPLHGEDFASLQNYIAHARERLGGMVNLDKFQASESFVESPRSKSGLEYASARLKKDVAASISCIFTAFLAHAVSQVLRNSLESCDHFREAIESFELYVSDVISMTPHLIRQSCRLASTHAISGKDVIFQIICLGNAWEDDDIQEYSNSYAEDLYERCGELWAFLSTSSPSMPEALLRYTWDHVVRSAFHTLIEGFSKVTNCSTGGRSLMSMDLNTLSDGLNPGTMKKSLSDAHPGVTMPHASSYRGEGKQYVDAYIKVFFYPDEVLHQWITENHKKYREEHMISLVTAKRAVGQESERFWELLEESIRALYRQS